MASGGSKWYYLKNWIMYGGGGGYIIFNIFVNRQSILMIIASKCNVFNGLCLCKTLQTMLKLWSSIKVTSCITAIIAGVLLSRYM